MEENGTISVYDTTPGYKLYYQYLSIDDSLEDKIDNSETWTEAVKLLPKYDESKWIKSDDNKFSIDSSTFEGEKTFALWAKLVSADGTVNYDVTVYTVSGTKKTETTTKSEETTNESNTNSNTKTDNTKTDNTKTDNTKTNENEKSEQLDPKNLIYFPMFVFGGERNNLYI